VVSEAPVAGATVAVAAIGQAVSAVNGAFSLTTPEAAAVRNVTVTSAAHLERSTWVQVPGSALTLSLIPSSLSTPGFEQMFRGNGGVLRRWSTAPVLVIEQSLLRFTNTGDAAYVALAPVLSAGEAEALREDLLWALPQLTGGAYQAFREVRLQTTPEGQFLSVVSPDIITVSRVEGLTSSAGFWGYARWSWDGTGAIRSGFMMLDRGFETSGSAFRRSLRAHELGHALGYNHVTATPSVMDQAARTEPNDFDRAASRVAFARPLLNRAPDTDPAPATTTQNTVWTSSGAP
jgi:hypothetical protein